MNVHLNLFSIYHVRRGNVKHLGGNIIGCVEFMGLNRFLNVGSIG